MERVAFIVDETGDRIDCLLNPETVEIKRLAGVRPRQSAQGQLVGAGLADDPLLFTGGGRTELTLDLVFDVELVESAAGPADVRAMTRSTMDSWPRTRPRNAAAADPRWYGWCGARHGTCRA